VENDPIDNESRPVTDAATATESPFRTAASAGEAHEELSLRPQRLEDFVGQRRVVENLSLAIHAARERGDVLDHCLLSGMPGLGKTTLSLLIATEMDVGPAKVASGPTLERGKDIVGLLTDLRRGDVLFIDEIHRMSPHAEEYLYSAMEDFCVDVMVDSGPDARSYRLPIEPFTLVGATTREGQLTAPLRSRFNIVERMEPYPVGDLQRIIERSASILGASISSEAAHRLACRSRGTPRFANRFLRRIRDDAQRLADWKRGDPLVVGLDAVECGLRRLDVDANGLLRVDRDILAILIRHGDQPVGLKTIAVSVGEEERTIEDVYEPYLIQQGFVIKTTRGRRVTSKALDHYAEGPSRDLFGPSAGET